MKAKTKLAALVLVACASPPAPPPEPRPVFPPPPDPPRVQFLMSIAGSGDVTEGPSWLDRFLFGEAADVEQPIQRPVGVAMCDGTLHVLDGQLALVHRVDVRQRRLEAVVPQGRGQLRTPVDLHLSADGNFYVADRGRQQVLVFDRDWTLLRELGPWGTDTAPVAVATWQDRVFVADVEARCVRVVESATGRELHVLESHPEDRERALRAPTGVSVDGNGYVYVVDAIYQRVLVFDRDLKFVRPIGEGGDEPGFFGRPKAVAVVDRTLWVLDSLYENCQILDLDGRPLLFFGGGGTGPGQLYLPRGMWIGTDGLDLFDDKLEPGFVAEQLVAITSFYGPRKISLYALGRSELPQFRDRYTTPPLPERPSPRAGTAAAPPASPGEASAPRGR